ncbi:Lysophospholipase 2 [Neolecta irregularis DAH-3]|uniref:Lysophospholipase n=1 Tax=Neolecta irregularis (strain DAH-3) TaxID=1198029 RepID=A0A1U7LL32_NEOID|nr:Lysophospholipase 2 [Neolecta irregularis DAH-3]|eukprot:OLL23348.1 Lysophospholipase 2 [Neolecta irregularis DAH-3]
MRDLALFAFLWAPLVIAVRIHVPFVPVEGKCPSSYIVNAQTLNPEEVDWLSKMSSINEASFRSYLSSYPDINISSVPNIGIALSGGGYRSMLTSLGVLQALDETPGFAGLLRTSRYITSLSGGAFAGASLATLGYPKIEGSLWNLSSSVFLPFGHSTVKNIHFWRDIFHQIKLKRDLGFHVSLTDYWGLALSKQLKIEGDLWSRTNATGPFPIIVTYNRPGDIRARPEQANATHFDISPSEIGSWQLNSLAQTKYLGSTANKCVEDFDDAGYQSWKPHSYSFDRFIVGVSSSVFHYVLVKAIEFLGLNDDLFGKLLEEAGRDYLVAQIPNPFAGIKGNPFCQESVIPLVDGALDGQGIPLGPLLRPQRKVDVIIAVDSADDKNDLPNGTSLGFTARYASSVGLPFPVIPDTDTFLSQNLTSRPTLFGCHSQEGPLIVYIANMPYSFDSAVTSAKLAFSDNDRDAMIENGRKVMTKDDDEVWAKCLACAISKRTAEREGKTLEGCEECWKEYCWN